MITIRPLSDHDSIIELTALLHRAYAELGQMGLNYTAVDQSAATTRERIQGGVCFVAETDGVLVGTILAMPTEAESECAYFTTPGVATLRQFAVDPQFRGKGIGQRLINQCEHWARQSGFSELALDTAMAAEHLVSLYARNGFLPVASVCWPGKCYQSVVMSKRLKTG